MLIAALGRSRSHPPRLHQEMAQILDGLSFCYDDGAGRYWYPKLRAPQHLRALDIDWHGFSSESLAWESGLDSIPCRLGFPPLLYFPVEHHKSNWLFTSLHCATFVAVTKFAKQSPHCVFCAIIYLSYVRGSSPQLPGEKSYMF